MSEALKCALVSLGCPKNLVDSEVMLGFLTEAGFELTTDESRADVLIVNTCAFLKASIDESISALRDIVHHKTEGNCKAVVATGCLPQRDLLFLQKAVPEIDGFLGVADLPEIVNVVRDAVDGKRPVAVTKSGYVYEDTTPRLLATPKWTAYVKIAEGCDHNCTFCVIPQIRGRFRSRPIESIVAEARQLAERGVREIVLISQDSTRYGLDIYERRNIDELMAALAKLEGLVWIRLLYGYPTFISDKLLETIASHDNLCKYIDVPLQHAHPEMLKSMKRAGSPEEYAKLIGKIRSLMPEASIRTSFIVGFPGETDDQFEFLLDFVETMQFDKMAAFRYSREAGAPSAEYPLQVPEEVAEARYHQLMVKQQRVSLQKNKMKIGRRVRVLIEQTSQTRGSYGSVPGSNGNGNGKRPGLDLAVNSHRWQAIGRTESDAPDIDASVLVHHCRAFPGEMVDVKITRARAYDLEGKQVNCE